MFKVRRQARKNKLASYGFLPFESHVLSSIKFNSVPYFKDMIDERKTLLHFAKKEHWTKEQYINAVKLEYERHEWIIKDTPQLQARGKRLKSVGRVDVWSMLKYYRELYKDNHDEYESPSKPKRRKRYDENNRRIDKGKVLEQQKRWREKQRRLRQEGN